MTKGKTAVGARANVKLLEKALGYQFQDQTLLNIALTHCSASAENNERFEFLGDSLVNLIMAETLYKKFPKASEGQLTRLRASCVKGETLGAIAQDFNLGNYLTLGPGELKSGGAHRPSILADALEALIAAIYLDSGFETVKARVLDWFVPRLAIMSDETTKKDPKTELQEILQRKKYPVPVYVVTEVKGDSHDQFFTVTCEIPLLPLPVIGKGASRRKAEQAAACAVLELLKDVRS